MSMSKKNEKREIKQDQLLSEWDFIRFCNEDQANTYVGGRMEINEQFLRAAEKDNLIKPILQIEGKIRQNDDRKKVGLVNHYSRHQIYLLAELRHNILGEDGNLRAPDTVDWHKECPKEQRPRYISWGLQGNGYLANKSNRESWDDEEEYLGGADTYRRLSFWLHSFLEFLHSFEQPKEPYFLPRDKRRYWENTPTTEYDFKPLKSGGKKLLAVYELDERKINILRKSVGQFAETIDPLIHWYYYIERHPEWKKDLLKGNASLAQEIYRLYYLLTRIWEITTKKRSEPIFEFIHKDFPHHPFWRPRTKYIDGEDIKALQYAIQQFKKWKQKKVNKPFVSDDIMQKIEEVERGLVDYEKRYGKYEKYQSYAGNVRDVFEEKEIKLADLDEKTKWYVDNTFAQIKDAKVEEEIPNAIEHRLRNLQRELQQIFRDISKQFGSRRNATWQRINEWGSRWWWENRDKLQGLNREEQIKLSRMEMKKVRQEAKGWEAREDEFHKSVSWYAGIVFCKSCREKPVRQYSENGSTSMWETNNSAICDDCLTNIRKNSLTTKDEWWKKANQAEWKCDCIKRNRKGEPINPMLYKFAYGNMVTLKTLAGVPIKFTTFYGKVMLEAKCPSCGKLHKRFIDWGWLP